VVALAGADVAIQHAPARAGEIVRSVAAVDRLAALLDVRAEVGLRDGLAATLASL
jgi:hypothetical protein